MPRFDNLASAAVTPGGVMSGVNDLVRSIMAGNQIRDQSGLQMQQAQMQQAQFIASDRRQTQRAQTQQDQFEVSDRRQALLGILSHLDRKEASGQKVDPGIRNAIQQAVSSTPRKRKVANTDPASKWSQPQIEQEVPDAEWQAQVGKTFNSLRALSGAPPADYNAAQSAVQGEDAAQGANGVQVQDIINELYHSKGMPPQKSQPYPELAAAALGSGSGSTFGGMNAAPGPGSGPGAGGMGPVPASAPVALPQSYTPPPATGGIRTPPPNPADAMEPQQQPPQQQPNWWDRVSGAVSRDTNTAMDTIAGAPAPVYTAEDIQRRNAAALGPSRSGQGPGQGPIDALAGLFAAEPAPTPVLDGKQNVNAGIDQAQLPSSISGVQPQQAQAMKLERVHPQLPAFVASQPPDQQAFIQKAIASGKPQLIAEVLRRAGLRQ